jgi:hypothetical protein
VILRISLRGARQRNKKDGENCCNELAKETDKSSRVLTNNLKNTMRRIGT